MLQCCFKIITINMEQKKVDEYLINAVFYDKIKFLPLIYGIPDFGASERVTISPSHFVKEFQNLPNFTISEMEYAHQNRVITHGCYDMTKWWQRRYHSLTNVGRQWFFMPQKVIFLMIFVKNIINLLNIVKELKIKLNIIY